MKCAQVQSLLVSYLNNETTPSERTLIRTHLSDCAVCRKELALLSEMQSQIGSALQRRAAQAVPAADAWERLEARLAGPAQPLPTRFNTRSWRLAPDVNRIVTQLFTGGMIMKRVAMMAGIAMLVIAIVAFAVFSRVPTVTAQDVLAQAYQAQAQAAPKQGILHHRSENYNNYQALPEGQGVSTIVDSYLDLQGHNVRLVVSDSETGKVLDAFANDGSYTYSSRGEYNGDVLTVYRTPQGTLSTIMEADSNGQDEKALFDQMRSDPGVQFVGKETWDDGRMVYILRSQQPVKALVDNTNELPIGQVTMYFDVTTYEILGTQATIERDGKEILINSHRVLADQVLPAGSVVAWDMSDMQGIAIVDDPDRAYGDLLPEVISAKELGARAQSAYLLKTIPEGYTLEISAPPGQPADEPFIYIASYRTAANDYLVIQSIGQTQAGWMHQETDELYTTANGLELRFLNEKADPSGRQYTSAVCKAQGNTTLLINSTLPRETVKAWAEELVPVK